MNSKGWLVFEISLAILAHCGWYLKSFGHSGASEADRTVAATAGTEIFPKDKTLFLLFYRRGVHVKKNLTGLLVLRSVL